MVRQRRITPSTRPLSAGLVLRTGRSLPRLAASLFAALGLVGAAGPTAWAHEGTPPAPHDLWTAWTWDPAVVLGLVAGAWVYARGVRALWRRAGAGRGIRRWQAAGGALGLVTLFLALVSPLDALSSALFSAHMVQHLLLILLAAPLLVLGRLQIAGLWALRPGARRRLTAWWKRTIGPRVAWQALRRPLVAWALHSVALWVWHLPSLYQAALRSQLIHALEHATFLSTALLFWWALVHSTTRGRFGYGSGLFYVFTLAAQGTALGALLTFSQSPWYPFYAASVATWGLSPLEDQQLAGLIMWIPGGLVYLAAGLWLVAAWLQTAEREMRREERLAWDQAAWDRAEK